MHKAPAIAGFVEGQIYAALSLNAEKLFPCFKPVISQSRWRNLAVGPRHTLMFYLFNQNGKKDLQIKRCFHSTYYHIHWL